MGKMNPVEGDLWERCREAMQGGWESNTGMWSRVKERRELEHGSSGVCGRDVCGRKR